VTDHHVRQQGVHLLPCAVHLDPKRAHVKATPYQQPARKRPL
jgi:hypothetical protein